MTVSLERWLLSSPMGGIWSELPGIPGGYLVHLRCVYYGCSHVSVEKGNPVHLPLRLIHLF